MTSQHSQQNLFNTMSSAEVFPVNQSAKQGTEKASRRLQGLVFGSNSSEPYAWYDQNTSSWKTYQRSLLTDWTLFSETFTRQGYMNANGVVFQAALLEPATKETDGGLLPTPIASKAVEQRVKFKQGGYSLRAAIDREMLPTPTATDYKGRSGQGYIDRHGEHRISDVLTKIGDNMNLNPAFVEEMMGYPIGWTDLKH
tara:strand:- start:111 stop:704 length:594 start_codon:yes stop_codon:yes gene_type:complete